MGNGKIMNDLSFLQFVYERRHDLLDNTIEHLFLTGVSVLIAVAIGIPLGILAYRSVWLRNMIIPLANTIQTIPSLAILALLLPLLGIGATPAITSLTLYALLPIIRNTYTGIAEIPKPVLQTAEGLGFSSAQKLWIIELPLAAPVMIAGIRTSAVICVGIATLSALIGAGGLGDFIVSGLSLNNTRLIILGAVPAAIMALIIDWTIGWIEKRISWKES